MSTQNDRIAVITGGGCGIGAAVATVLSQEGYTVILLARGKEGLNSVKKAICASGGKAEAYSVDLCDLRAVKQFSNEIEKKFGRIDVLWNGAFGWIEGPLETNSPEEIASFLDSSVRGPIVLTRELLPLLMKSTKPHILNVAADWEFPLMQGLAPFIAAKRALAGFGIALQKEKSGKIRVTNIHPADVASKGYDLAEPPSELVARTDGKLIPLKELAELVSFILKLDGMIVHQIDVKPLAQDVGMTFL